MKTCNRCKKEKDETVFYKDPRRVNYSSLCYECHKSDKNRRLKKWREKNIYHVREQKKLYRQTEKYKKTYKRYVEANRCRINELAREARIRNIDYYKKYSIFNKIRMKEYQRDYYSKNRNAYLDKLKAKNANRINNLKDGYVKSLLIEQGWAAELLSIKELIELKRLQIKTKREIKNQTK